MRAQAANNTALPMEPLASESLATENDDMMAGSAIYQRIQTKPKKSVLTYVVPAVVVLALGAGAAIYALKPASTPPAAASQQQANVAAQQASAAADKADASAKSAVLASEQAQANQVAATGKPPASVVVNDSQPTRTRTITTVVHKAPVRMTVGTRPAPPPSAAAAGVDASALTPPPAPVTATPPAQTTVQPAPVNPPAPADATPSSAQPMPPSSFDQTPPN